MLRRLWARLKIDGNVGGLKRASEAGSSKLGARPSSPKKSKMSSDVSSTCERIASVLLSREGYSSSLSASSDEVFTCTELSEVVD